MTTFYFDRGRFQAGLPVSHPPGACGSSGGTYRGPLASAASGIPNPRATTSGRCTGALTKDNECFLRRAMRGRTPYLPRRRPRSVWIGPLPKHSVRRFQISRPFLSAVMVEWTKQMNEDSDIQRGALLKVGLPRIIHTFSGMAPVLMYAKHTRPTLQATTGTDRPLTRAGGTAGNIDLPSHGRYLFPNLKP